MKLITNIQKRKLLENGCQTQRDGEGDHWPVVKLFTPDAGAIWLLTELDPEEPDIAFGLSDLGLGFPELGYVRLSELAQLRGPLGLPVERDRHFTPTMSIGEYAKKARAAGQIAA